VIRIARVPWPSAAAAAALLLYAAARLVVGEPFVGATVLLLLGTGLSLLPFVPRRLRRLSLEVAILPALALAGYATLLTTVSIVGIRLTETSIALSTALLAGAALVPATAIQPSPAHRTPLRREAPTMLALAAIVVFAFASSWDVAYPFQPRGTDWGHYLLYADEVATQGHLLIDDPFAGDGDWVFADPAGVGAVYGSFLLSDGVSSWSLTAGIAVISALTVLSVFAAAATLWGTAAGLVAAGAYAVAPIRLEPMYWHGLGTALAMVFVPLVVMSLGLLFRGARGWRHALLLGLALVGVAAAHTTSAIVVGAVILLAPLVDLAVRLVAGRSEPRAAVRDRWMNGLVRPLAAAVGIACVLGAGVVAHLALQVRALGRPVSWRFLGPDWLDRAAVEHYYGVPFLVVALVAVALLLTSRRLRRDVALLSPASVALACVVVGQLWRVHVSFDYQRVVYYLGVALALLIGAVFVRRTPHAAWIAVFVLAFVVIARGSVGLRLPERVLESEPRAPGVSGLVAFREQLDSGVLPDAGRIVSDGCLHFAVPYLVRRPTLPAFSERQVGFVDRLPLSRQAAVVLAGGREGAAAAARLGVRYVVADPDCVPDLATRVGGTTVVANEGVVVVRLPGAR
jgi:hypothetical protein